MNLKATLLENRDFIYNDGMFYQRGNQGESAFEQNYHRLREKENRVYTDDVVRTLPITPTNHPLKSEWMMRGFMLGRVMRYLSAKSRHESPVILEVGCGNGWLCNHLASIENSQVLGIDVNEHELKQAERLFGFQDNLCFAYAKVCTSFLPTGLFDYIVLAASIQYFHNTEALIKRLLELLTDGGEIHIFDSPIYAQRDVSLAKARSAKYFSQHDSPDMEQYYHHHTRDEFEAFHAKSLYNPTDVVNKVRGVFSIVSPFPWMQIGKKKYTMTI